jgi:hypothetical protein
MTERIFIVYDNGRAPVRIMNQNITSDLGRRGINGWAIKVDNEGNLTSGGMVGQSSRTAESAAAELHRTLNQRARTRRLGNAVSSAISGHG